MKINWKVRIKNPVFWVTFIPSVCTFVYMLLSCFDVVPSVSEEAVVNALLTFVTALENLGVLVDPTTVGVSDSERAMTYTKPN